MVLLTGCAADPRRDSGLDLINAGRFEEGLQMLETLARDHPHEPRYRSQWLAERESVIALLLRYAQNQAAADNATVAESTYRRILALALDEPRALAGLAQLQQSRSPPAAATRETLAVASTPSATSSLRLGAAYQKKVSLDLRDAELKFALAALSQQTGINFIFDRDVPPDGRVTLGVTDAAVEDVIDWLLKTQNLTKKIINDHSFLVFPNVPDKVQAYEDLTVKSFFLTHADGVKTLEMLKTLLKLENAVVDERLNIITVRAPQAMVAMAESLVATHDLPPAEVMLELEVLEVKRSRLKELGIQFPNQLTLTPIGSTGSGTTLEDLQNLNAEHISADLGSLILTLRKETGDATILANPRVRVHDREKAKILIGDRVPVITTTSTSTGFVSESVQYVDVGLSLQVEPHVNFSRDVAITVALEVSNIVKEVTSQSGTLAYQIGTRSASTVLRLKDGETQVLAGLISDEERKSATKVPGLGDLPVLGHLFSSDKDENQKTEIVLSITPRILRPLEKPEVTAPPFENAEP